MSSERPTLDDLSRRTMAALERLRATNDAIGAVAVRLHEIAAQPPRVEPPPS